MTVALSSFTTNDFFLLFQPSPINLLYLTHCESIRRLLNVARACLTESYILINERELAYYKYRISILFSFSLFCKFFLTVSYQVGYTLMSLILANQMFDQESLINVRCCFRGQHP